MRKSTLLLLAVIVFMIFISVVLGIWWMTGPLQVEKTIVKIPKNASAREISHILYENKLIKSRFLFYMYVRMSGFSRKLSYGKYLFEGHNSMAEVVDVLLSGRVFLTKVIIKEGSSLRESLEQIASSELVEYAVLDSLANDSAFVNRLTGLPVESLEGFVYPETYFFDDNIRADELLGKIVEYFFYITRDLNFLNERGFDFYQTLTLASIVEKESVILEEKPVIASVYLNRLAVGQKLQADPTVVYILEKGGRDVNRVYYKNLKIDSPYNTYIYKGLPPTPICSPTVSSIQAVLTPEVTDYFYFVASRGGYHVFSKTYKEHLQKIKKIRKK